MKLQSSGAIACIAAALLLAGCAGFPAVAPLPSAPTETVAVDQDLARRIISAYRVQHGRGEVALDPALQRAAQRQADAMAGRDELSHTVAGPLPIRLAEAGADRPAAIENISGGYGDLRAAIQGWRRSPAHDANLLFGPMRRLGIAAARAPHTRFKTFWSLIMTD